MTCGITVSERQDPFTNRLARGKGHPTSDQNPTNQGDTMQQSRVVPTPSERAAKIQAALQMLGKPPYERGAIAAVARRLAVDSGTLSIWLSRVERGQLDPATGYFDPEWVAQESARKLRSRRGRRRPPLEEPDTRATPDRGSYRHFAAWLQSSPISRRQRRWWRTPRKSWRSGSI